MVSRAVTGGCEERAESARAGEMVNELRRAGVVRGMDDEIDDDDDDDSNEGVSLRGGEEDER